jgi:serine/threonine protein kinase
MANEWFIVMELLRGGELFDRIVAKKHYDETGAKNIMEQIVSALIALHEHEPAIIHRDLKPENLVFENCEEGSPIKVLYIYTCILCIYIYIYICNY